MSKIFKKTLISLSGSMNNAHSPAPHLNVHVPISRTCESVTLYGKRVFADVIKNLEIRRSSCII